MPLSKNARSNSRSKKHKDTFPHPLMVVVWKDAASASGWMFQDEAEAETTPKVCVSVGFVFKETNEAICLMQTFSPDTEGVADIIIIPTAMVVGKQVIRGR